MSGFQSMKFPGHDVLARLARDEPLAFEELRRELIENCIDRASVRNQPRLHQLQFRVDSIRYLSRSPLGATLKIHALMWEHFLEMDEKLQCCFRRNREPSRVPKKGAVLKNTIPEKACVIELHSRRPAAAGR